MGGDLVHIKAFKPHPIPYQSDVFTEGIGGGCDVGGVLVHIKAFKPHLIRYQSDVFTEGIHMWVEI